MTEGVPRTVHLVDELTDLRADCSRCSGLCCVALPYAASVDFAYDKPAGQACRHLDGYSCTIHAVLAQRGFPGCVAFDCLGAGQQVTQRTYAGSNWRDQPQIAAEIFDVFVIMRQLHELRWYLHQADRDDQPAALRDRVRELTGLTRRLAEKQPTDLLRIDLAAHRHTVDQVLSQVSRRVRTAATRAVHDSTGRPTRTRRADLAGATLTGVDLRGCDFRGALLLGADLRDVDLGGADLIGADLRGADLRGADLSAALYLTEPQVAGAVGDGETRLPTELRRPVRWPPQSAGAAPT